MGAESHRVGRRSGHDRLAVDLEIWPHVDELTRVDLFPAGLIADPFAGDYHQRSHCSIRGAEPQRTGGV